MKDKEVVKAYNKAYYQKNKEKLDAVNKEYCSKNKETVRTYKKQWQDEHKEQKAAYEKQRYSENKEKHAEVMKEWRTTFPWKVNALTAKRRASKTLQTPSWLTLAYLFEIECFYIYSSALNSVGLSYHVDHIVPLQGKQARGLHVPWNLQVIPAVENIRKGNRLEYQT